MMKNANFEDEIEDIYSRLSFDKVHQVIRLINLAS